MSLQLPVPVSILENCRMLAHFGPCAARAMSGQGHDKEGPTVASISQVSGLYLCFGNYLTHDLDLVLIDPSREVVCGAASAVAVKSSVRGIL